MRQIYVITLFFLPVWCFSQLSIQPYKNLDSYVFVENRLLFVEKEIKLTANPTEAVANIYLRDEAQLLQGKVNSANSGNGTLSVFQEGKATAYTYNYWSSPVENTTLNESFGNIFYEPVSKTNSRKAGITQNYNGHAKPLTISNKWIYKLTGQEYSDWEYIGENFDLEPGEGFTMKGVDGVNTETIIYGIANNPGEQQRYDFRGKPNSGNISLSIKSEEIKLIGNPYPSALDLNAFLMENQNITGIAYFWDSHPVDSHYLQDYVGGYGAYSPALGSNGYVPAAFEKYDNEGIPVEHTGSTGNHYARRFSPIAQGFVVEGLKDGQILFQNKYRVYQKENVATSQFKSKALATEINADPEISLLRFQVEFNDYMVRELLLAFHPTATKGIDRAMDAVNLSPANNDAGWNIDNKNFQINVLPFDAATSKIPLMISTVAPTEVVVRLINSENFSENIFLWDSHSEILYEIAGHKVELQLPKGDYLDRFFITFENKLPEILPESPNLFLILQNNPLQKTEIISPLSIAVKNISIFDSTGRKIKEIQGETGQNHYEIPTAHLSRGFYIIKILSAEGTVVSKKVIISN